MDVHTKRCTAAVRRWEEGWGLEKGLTLRGRPSEQGLWRAGGPARQRNLNGPGSSPRVLAWPWQITVSRTSGERIAPIPTPFHPCS